MTIEDAEHGTRNTEHGAHGTPGATGALVLRSAAPVEHTPASGTPNTERSVEPAAERSAEHPDHSAERSASAERNDGTDRSADRSVPMRWSFRARAERNPGLRENVAEARRNAAIAERQRNDAIRAEQQRAERSAIALRRTTRTRSARPTAEQIAPLPNWMRIVGVWFDRTFGALPLVAPLLVSGFFTSRVMTDDPISAPLAVAIIITMALEGGVWKLAKLMERTLLEGDSTISLRMGIFGYLSLISGGIFGHAYYQAYDATAAGEPVQLTWGDWLPAAATALMSMLGVYIWSKDARFKHRVELRNMNLIDSQAPKFSVLAWLLLPLETGMAFRHAVRFRISSPKIAVADRRFWVAAGRPKVWIVDGTEQADEQNTPDQQGAERNTLRSAPSVPPTTAERNTQRNGGTRGTEHLTMEQLGRERYAAAQRSVERSVLDRLEAELVGENVPQERSTEHGTERNGAQRAGGGVPRNAVPADTARSNGTRNGTERGTQDGLSAEMLKHSANLLDVVAELPGWQAKVPSVRAVQEAISTARQRRGERPFNSTGIAADVARELRRIAEHPDAAGQIDQLRGPASN